MTVPHWFTHIWWLIAIMHEMLQEWRGISWYARFAPLDEYYDRMHTPLALKVPGLAGFTTANVGR